MKKALFVAKWSLNTSSKTVKSFLRFWLTENKKGITVIRQTKHLIQNITTYTQTNGEEKKKKILKKFSLILR